mmetsp:Transcript_27178/g.69192  ORF Transcript_27178/g.69192 Transcript_27178/m.69192 type:complete len:278 (-) Transcript_27178:593-1426(-)|eukprot:CAMPEP_0202857532 /NCGR_PEP_ID=MMETSP1391-20130828/436_1 /ASSEMBLY_ACC=CAM_ASM_000867 /TAXON_ID=1034604 /ORGANISM="Chlamydomonas leiostraca, Strain SAG 11-49" /LENGTH=277 /DNA_ID=CAMNT_0049536343 /DNA_START=64 /DNA_END=897 /DNA_ORIENTATION=-
MSSPVLSPPGGRSYSPLRTSAITTSGDWPSAGPTVKLEHVSEKFAGLWTDLEQEKQNRRIQESTRMQLFQESVQRMEKSLEAEVKRRAESDKQLQSHFEGELRALQERMAAQTVEMQSALKSAVESLSSRVQDLHALIREEREQRRNDIEHLATSLVGKVNECVSALDEERTARVHEQSIGLKRFGEDLMTLQQRLDAEKLSRDAEVGGLRTEIHDVLGNRSASDDQFKNATLDELAQLKSALALEREERIAEDDEIVQAINDYTKALQEGLKLVNA